MKKIFDFIKNYKKILIVGLIGLVLVLLCSIVIQSIRVRKGINDTNDKQLVKIYQKAVYLDNTWEAIIDSNKEPYIQDIEVVYRLVQLEPDDICDSEFIEKCVEYITGISNLIIVNNSRQPICGAGEIRGIDYSKTAYDGLFSSPEGMAVTVYDEGSNSLKTVGIKAGDKYLLTQVDEDKHVMPSTSDETLWKISKMSVGLDSSSLFAVVNKTDGSMVYSEIKNLSVDDVELKNTVSGMYSTEDEDYLVQYYDTDDGLRLLALTPKRAIVDRYVSNLILTVILVIFALFILISYIVCLRQDKTDPEQEYTFLKKYFLHYQTKNFRALTIIIGILIGIAFIFVSNITESEYNLAYLENESDKCVEVYMECAAAIEGVNEYNQERMFGYGRMTGYFLNKHDDYRSKKGMTGLADAFDVSYLSAVDAEGNTMCTSSPLDNLNIFADPESSLCELGNALIGKEGVVVSGDDNKISSEDYIYAVPWRNSEGIADGLIAVTVLHDSANYIGADIDILNETLIDNNRACSGARAFFVNNYGVIISKENVIEDCTAVEEQTMKDGYSGIISFDGKDYLGAVEYIESTGDYLYLVIPFNRIEPSTVANTLILIVMYIILAIWMWYDGLGSKYHFEKRKSKVKDADDWERTELYWEELTINQKMAKIFSLCVYVLTVFFIIIYLMIQCGLMANHTLEAILSGNWNDSVNGYSVMINISIICVFFTGTKLIENLLLKVESIAGGDGVTVCRLISSLLKYVSAIICAYIVVTNFGVDAAAAIASLGIVSFALTFGAQELIKDMIAGMFILFEGNFKVGDMLDVNGEWYWIKSIGVRTTTMDAWGTVKVVNNSQMTGMINIQNASEVVNCDVWVEPQYDIDEIGNIMKEELPKMKELFTPDVSTPVWKGIQELTASGTLIRVRTYCPPLKQGQVGRIMRHEVKRILDEHGINLALEGYMIHSQTIDPDKMRKEIEDAMHTNTSENKDYTEQK